MFFLLYLHNLGNQSCLMIFFFTLYPEKIKIAEYEGFQPHSGGVVCFSLLFFFFFKVPDFCLFETHTHSRSNTWPIIRFVLIQKSTIIWFLKKMWFKILDLELISCFSFYMSVLHFFSNNNFLWRFSEIELRKLVTGCLIIHHICNTKRFFIS